MTLEELQNWILSEGLGEELTRLSRYSAARSVEVTELATDLRRHVPDWHRLLFAGSILTKAPDSRAVDAALMIAHAGLLLSNDPGVHDSSATLLTQLANHPAVRLAEQRGLLKLGLDSRVGASEQMLLAKRELTHSVFLSGGAAIQANPFQRQLWDDLNRSSWVSASAPTASGKTYLVLQWLLNEFARGAAKFAIFVAPTRALVGEIERQLMDFVTAYQLNRIRVASLPIAELGDGSRPTILVFTQERLHVFLNSLRTPPVIDIAVIDEVQAR